MIPIDQIKQLRAQTGISLGECKTALEQSSGDLNKAKQILKDKGLEFAQKKKEREARAGLIASYVHSNKKIGVLLDLRCETDFVAKNNKFQELAQELCLQIAAMSPENKKGLLKELWIKDEKRIIKDLISEYIAQLGENIEVEKFVRYELQ